MKRGCSFVSFVVKNKPEHNIVKVIREKYGDCFDDAELIYIARYSDNEGWTLNGHWIGINTESAIRTIKKENISYAGTK